MVFNRFWATVSGPPDQWNGKSGTKSFLILNGPGKGSESCSRVFYDLLKKEKKIRNKASRVIIVAIDDILVICRFYEEIVVGLWGHYHRRILEIALDYCSH